MSGELLELVRGADGAGVVLVCVAAPVEGRAVLRGLGADGTPEVRWRAEPVAPGVDLVMTGVGKANAAAGVARALERGRHRAVLNVGVGGVLPGAGGGKSARELGIGDIVIATESVYADEGNETPDGFLDLAAMGFPPGPGEGMGVACDEAAAAALERALGSAASAGALRRGTIATVSICAGTDARAADVAARTGAVVEAMEGAAIAMTLRRLDAEAGAGPTPFLEVRSISNTTGDRAGQWWDLTKGMEGVERAARAVRAGGARG